MGSEPLDQRAKRPSPTSDDWDFSAALARWCRLQCSVARPRPSPCIINEDTCKSNKRNTGRLQAAASQHPLRAPLALGHTLAVLSVGSGFGAIQGQARAAALAIRSAASFRRAVEASWNGERRVRGQWWVEDAKPQALCHVGHAEAGDEADLVVVLEELPNSEHGATQPKPCQLEQSGLGRV